MTHVDEARLTDREDQVNYDCSCYACEEYARYNCIDEVRQFIEAHKGHSTRIYVYKKIDTA